jgi:hypothetical protein
MMRNFFDRSPQQQNVIISDAVTLQKEQYMIAGCEACSEAVKIPAEARVRGSDPSVTDYVLEVLVLCLQ